MTLDGEGYRDLATLGFEWRYALQPTQGLVGSVQYGAIRYDEDEFRDVDLAVLGVNWDYRKNAWQVVSGLFYGLESAKEDQGEHFGRSYAGARFSVKYTLSKQHHLNGAFSYQGIEYDEEHPAFAQVRDDTSYQGSFSWGWRFNDRLDLTLRAEYIDNDSNLTLYQYQRWLSSVGVQFKF